MNRTIYYKFIRHDGQPFTEGESSDSVVHQISRPVQEQACGFLFAILPLHTSLRPEIMSSSIEIPSQEPEDSGKTTYREVGVHDYLPNDGCGGTPDQPLLIRLPPSSWTIYYKLINDADGTPFRGDDTVKSITCEERTPKLSTLRAVISNRHLNLYMDDARVEVTVGNTAKNLGKKARIADECGLSADQPIRIRLGPQTRTVFYRLIDVDGNLIESSQADCLIAASVDRFLDERSSIYAQYSLKKAQVFYGSADGEMQLLASDERLYPHGGDDQHPLIVKIPEKADEYSLRLFIEPQASIAVEQSFQLDYDDPHGHVQEFVEGFVDYFGSNWRDLKFFAPYCSLVQSSGTGKTRFLRQVASRRFMFYICLRREGKHYGYPYRSYCSNEFMNFRKQQEVIRFISNCLSYLNQFIQNNGSDSFDKFIDLQLAHSDDSELSGSAFWEDVSKHSSVPNSFEHVNGVSVCFAFDEARALTEQLEIKSNDSNLNRFRIVRRALNAYKECTAHVTAVFTDTNSRLMIFSPPREFVPSARLITGEWLDLPAPYWTIPGWKSPRFTTKTADVTAMDVDSDQTDGPPQSTEDETAPLPEDGSPPPPRDEIPLSPQDEGPQPPRDELPLLPQDETPPPPCQLINTASSEKDVLEYAMWSYSFGRPLWRGFLQKYPGTDTKAAIDYCRNVSIAKLVCQEDTRIPLTDTKILAVLEARLCLKISASSIVASDLVSQHMAINYFVSPARDYMMIGYPIEPVVSAAAQHWMRSIPIRRMIQVLIDNSTMGVIQKGYRGELVTKLLLTIGFDSALQRQLNVAPLCPDLMCITVKDFLETTFGPQAFSALDRSCFEDDEGKIPIESRCNSLSLLLEGSLRITKWIKLNDDVANLDPNELFHFGAAAITRENAVALDKVIPVRLSSGEYTWILIQDKNNEKCDEVYPLASNICQWSGCISDSPSQPYLILYLQTGTARPPAIENIFLTRRVTRTNMDPAENNFQFILGISGVTDSTWHCLKSENDPHTKLIKAGSQSSTDSVQQIAADLEMLRDGIMTATEPTIYGAKIKQTLASYPLNCERCHDLRIVD